MGTGVAALRALGLGVLLGLVTGPAAMAQNFSPSGAIHLPPEQPISRTEPVYYQADSATYDRDSGIATLAGHVEMWQGSRVMRADKVTYDRNTGVAAARGHVVLLDPNGMVYFADYAELSQGMKDGVLSNIRAQLAENGRLAANGARRLDARINDFSRVIYSTCNACKSNPLAPLEWDIRARSAVQDLDDKRIEYSDAVIDVYGVPVLYLPYFTTPDPSAKRASGILVPSLGYTKYLGPFVQVPYYWVIDKSTDATFAPLLANKGGNGPGMDAQFRHTFNDGLVNVNTSLAYSQNSVQGDVFANGQFAVNDEWRWGFDLQRATSATYMLDYHLPGQNVVLTSTVYLEGFGQGSYSRLDAYAYQGLVSSYITAELPFVLPRYQYSFVGEPDALGGRTSIDAGAFNVVRQIGADTRRVNFSANWERPVTGALGDLWKLVLHVDSAAYDVDKLNQQPSWGAASAAASAQAMPTMALEGRWPLTRTGGGTQVIEPIVQLIGAPRGSSYGTVRSANGTPLYLNTLIPNEDSLDFEFTDANLFALNRFPGVDRLEGGTRANVGLHGTWYFGSGQSIDALVGQGYRTSPDLAFPKFSGLQGTISDVVTHLSYTPNQYLDFTTRQRFDHRDMALDFFDGLATAGPAWLKFNAGYIYERYNPYAYYDSVPTGVVPINSVATDNTLLTTPLNEVTVGLNTKLGRWKVGLLARRDLEINKMVETGANVSYEDECVIVSANYFRLYTSFAGFAGDTILLFQITLKTVGTFGFNGL